MGVFDKFLDLFKLESTREKENHSTFENYDCADALLNHIRILAETIKTTTNEKEFEQSLSDIKSRLYLLSGYEKIYDFPQGVPSKELERIEKNEYKIRERFRKRVEKINAEKASRKSAKPKKRIKKEKNQNTYVDSKKPILYPERFTIEYAAMCEKHARERDYMEKLGILEAYEDEMKQYQTSEECEEKE